MGFLNLNRSFIPSVRYRPAAVSTERIFFEVQRRQHGDHVLYTGRQTVFEGAPAAAPEPAGHVVEKSEHLCQAPRGVSQC